MAEFQTYCIYKSPPRPVNSVGLGYHLFATQLFTILTEVKQACDLI